MQAGDVKIPPRFVVDIRPTAGLPFVFFLYWSLDCVSSGYAPPLYVQSAAFGCLL